MTQKNKEYFMFGASVLMIAVITGIPLFARGLGGDIWDATYHILRIESMKEALVNGDFPPRLNPLFFHHYGYGSSLFYPDIFLVVPALLNICGLSLLLSYKIFFLLVSVAGTCTTYFSIRHICGSWKYALTGSYVLMLSVFYLADVNNRAGLSEYLACVFIPVLVAGIYDFIRGGTASLIGIAFLGLGLSHTIMTFVGVLITAFILLVSMLLPEKRKAFAERGGMWKKLLFTAIIVILSAAYYIFPMAEQILSGRFRFNEPWAQVGSYTQTFRSFLKPFGVFLYTADFGVGIPVLVLLAGRLFLGKLKNRWADFFIILGTGLLLAMTKIFPWKYLEHTPLNFIQFTYRLYPYALFFIICGMSCAYAEKDGRNRIKRVFPVFLILLSVGCGIGENVYCYRFGTRVAINCEYLTENTYLTGKGEWIPEGVTEDVAKGAGRNVVLSENGEIPWKFDGYNRYSFETDGGSRIYVAPLLYYKGYRADIISPDGERHELDVGKSAEGLLKVTADTLSFGTVEVWYDGTLIQTVSNVISCLTVFGVIVALLVKRRKKQGKMKIQGLTDASSL